MRRSLSFTEDAPEPTVQGLRINALSLANFRNYDKFSLENIGNLTIITGKNGVGKTNVLEAVSLLTSAGSIRTAQTVQLLRNGVGTARLSMDTTDGNRELTTELLLEPGKKRYLVNGKPKSAADVRGTLPAVSFVPDDLDIAKRSSSVKRNAIDDLGVQLSRNYYIVRRDYEKTLRYKNRLLKEGASAALVESINETLITCGSQLFTFRQALFSRLVPIVSSNYNEISQSGEEFCATYQPSWDYLDEKPVAPSLPDQGLSRDEVREKLTASLRGHRDRELARASSLVGPHNDKISFHLAGRDASAFASQGQQRSIVLAWKLAEVQIVRQSLNTSPVLLLDDVMSELDEVRRDMLVRFVTDDIQTFITATDLSGFNQSLLSRAHVLHLEQREAEAQQRKAEAQRRDASRSPHLSLDHRRANRSAPTTTE